jgi:uncharacterized membrane protein
MPQLTRYTHYALVSIAIAVGVILGYQTGVKQNGILLIFMLAYWFVLLELTSRLDIQHHAAKPNRRF